jgi:deoxyribonuclease-1
MFFMPHHKLQQTSSLGAGGGILRIHMLALSMLVWMAVVMPARAAEPGYAGFVENLMFWEQLYPNGGWTLYCGAKFEDAISSLDGDALGVERIVPVEWVLGVFNCESKEKCRETREAYRLLETDLHNMYPVIQEVQKLRQTAPYGLVRTRYRQFRDCPFKRSRGIVEPRPEARGNIARTIFYVHAEYGLPLDSRTLSTLQEWNLSDPPNWHEERRNTVIERFQGKRNMFVDQPWIADELVPAE